MDEARRFLRYVSPGLVLGVETIVLLLILVPSWMLPRLAALSSSQGVGAAIALFLASGGIGFILSTVHHSLNWWCDEVLDHKAWLTDLVRAKVIAIREKPGE